jgi:hypothetical protein
MSDPPGGERAPQDQERVRAGYDAVADAYVARVHDELGNKPLDRGLLLVAVHLGEHGDATVHADDMLGVSVDRTSASSTPLAWKRRSTQRASRSRRASCALRTRTSRCRPDAAISWAAVPGRM